MFYLDPRYWDAYGMELGWENYQQMSHLAQSIQGTMIISHKHNEQVSELFSWAHFKEVKYTYTVGGQKNKKEDTELIISNRPLEHTQRGLF